MTWEQIAVMVAGLVVAALGGGGAGGLLIAWSNRRDSLLTNWQKQVTFFQLELEACRTQNDALETKIDAQAVTFGTALAAQRTDFEARLLSQQAESGQKIESMALEITWLRAWVRGTPEGSPIPPAGPPPPPH